MLFFCALSLLSDLSSQDPRSQTGLCCKSSSNWSIAKRAIASGQLPARVYYIDLSHDEQITEA